MKSTLGWALAIGLLLAGCEPDLRVPYIPAKLESWPEPYRGIEGVEVHVFSTGEMRVPEGLVFRGGSMSTALTLDVLAFVIRHPKHGWIVVDTGLNPAVDDASSAYVGLVPSLLLHPRTVPGKSLTLAMRAESMAPAKITRVVLTNLRFVRAGDLEQLPDVEVLVARRERQYASEGHIGYLRQEADQVETWKEIDFSQGTPLGTFSRHVDLLGDGSINLIDASGPTPGNIAVLVRTAPHPVLLGGDLIPVEASLRYAAPPVFTSAREETWEAFWRVKKLKQLVPDLVVLPGYDLRPARRSASKSLVLHETEEMPPPPSPTAPRRGWKPVPLP